MVTKPNQQNPTKNITYKKYDLADQLDDSYFQGVDYLVHTAYVKQDRNHPDAMNINVTAAEQLVTAAKEFKLKKSLFMSSMSAHAGAESVYGKQKLAIEKLFTTKGDVVVRSGLIIGNGGIVDQMISFMKSKRLVPLVGGGKQPLQIIALADLVQTIDKLLTSTLNGTFTVATQQVYTYKEFYQAISKQLSIRVWYVPVPLPLLIGALKLVSLLHLPLAINQDNVLGLKHLRAVKNSADLEKIGIAPKSLEEALRVIK